MTAAAQGGTARTLDELTLGDAVSLEELVDRRALVEMVSSFVDLFGMPLRVFSRDGSLLADPAEQPQLYQYLGTFKAGRAALQRVVAMVKSVETGEAGEASQPCFTGAVYHVVSIDYDGRNLGRMVMGPFLPPSVKEVPAELLGIDPAIDPIQLRDLMTKLPRARQETVTQIARHLRSTLDLILFRGHKALLTSNMHLASVRESFRDLQEKNASLQEAFNRLKELDRLKSNFLATVSHELRTPLTSIIGYSEMLIEGIAGEMPAEQSDFVRTIHEKGEQLLELITGLLDLSKLESGTMNMKKTEVDLAVVVADVVQTLSPSAMKRQVELTANLPSDLGPVWGDAARLRQILLNLVENALKFTPTDGTVTVSARPSTLSTRGEGDGADDEDDDDDMGAMALFAAERPAVELRVADTGVGIPEAERAKIFNAFYQVDNTSTRQVGGTGLGLSIVKRLLEAHGGTIWVEENTPSGAVFVVTLPCPEAGLA